MTKKPAIILFAVVACAAIGFVLHWNYANRPEDPDTRDVLRGVIELDELSNTSNALIIGYNYHLLEDFASECGKEIEISLSRRPSSCLDSLKRKSIDILVVPFTEKPAPDSTIQSNPIDSLCLWQTSFENRKFLKRINGWIAELEQSEEHGKVRDAFLVNFNPYKHNPDDGFSPYDPIIKAYADSIGWDWRLLGAMIYKESRFHIEAVSHRGAAGLMQTMRSTSESLGITDPLNPEGGVRAGALYIKKLSRRFRSIAADRDEQIKFTLAAYNAGETRILDCIKYAGHKGADSTRWEGITTIIPEMSDSSVVESGILSCGKFYGIETIDYVDGVLKIYDDFKKIYK